MGRCRWLILVVALCWAPSLQASPRIKVGSFTKTTSAAPVTQNVAHGLGQPPAAVILWTVGRTGSTFGNSFLWGIGVSDLTTERSFAAASENGAGTSSAARRLASKALTIVQWGPSTVAEASISAADNTNFTLNWSTNDASATIIHFLAIGGDGVRAKVVGWTAATSTGNKAVTGVGFRPQVVFHISGGGITASSPTSGVNASIGLGAMDASGNQWAISALSADGLGTTDAQRVQLNDAAYVAINNTPGISAEAAWVSMDSDGFTTNFSTTTSAYQVASLALAGLRAKVGTFAKTTASATASQSVTGVGFQPKALFLASNQLTASAGASSDTRLAVGVSDGTTQGAAVFSDDDAQDISDVDTLDSTTKTFIKVNNSTSTINAQCTTSSMDTDGFTLSWTTNDASATEICYVALAPRRVMIFSDAR